MIFSVGIKKGSMSDIANICRNLSADEQERIELTVQYLVRVELREDAHLKGEGSPLNPAFRKLIRGDLEVFYELRALEDRYLEVAHFRRAVSEET